MMVLGWKSDTRDGQNKDVCEGQVEALRLQSVMLFNIIMNV